VLFYQAFNQSQTSVRTLLDGLGQIDRNILFLENLFVFLEFESTVQDPPQPQPVPTPLQQGIAFQHVSFHYPGSERYILQDFSLHIPAGQITAIVGANGAGKTTLTKLLARFYDPQEGMVLLDGVDIRTLAMQDVRRQISIMFQFPMRYAETVAQNIALGDIHLVQGCTVIIITHRFTTARQADIIHVMEAGQIVDSGHHDELLAANGRYAESWYRQVERKYDGIHNSTPAEGSLATDGGSTAV
jgi:ABC-type multidrug transport system fused ATPase/permease subunit